MSLFVGMIFLAAVTAGYKLFGLGRRATTQKVEE